MRKVKVKRDDLLVKIKANRVTHIAEYKTACDGYREMALERIEEISQELKDRISSLKKGQVIALVQVQFGLAVPVSHEKDYDQVVAMLEMSVDSELEISSDEFACYVMDDWEWKEQFRNSNTAYLAKMSR